MVCSAHPTSYKLELKLDFLIYDIYNRRRLDSRSLVKWHGLPARETTARPVPSGAEGMAVPHPVSSIEISYCGR